MKHVIRPVSRLAIFTALILCVDLIDKLRLREEDPGFAFALTIQVGLWLSVLFFGPYYAVKHFFTQLISAIILPNNKERLLASLGLVFVTALIFCNFNLVNSLSSRVSASYFYSHKL